MNALMAKLTNLAEGMEETQADLQEKTYVVEGIAKGIKQAMAVIQQHLDHAEEIQAQEDAADAYDNLSDAQLAERAQGGILELLRRANAECNRDMGYADALASTLHSLQVATDGGIA